MFPVNFISGAQVLALISRGYGSFFAAGDVVGALNVEGGARDMGASPRVFLVGLQQLQMTTVQYARLTVTCYHVGYGISLKDKEISNRGVLF